MTGFSGRRGTRGVGRREGRARGMAAARSAPAGGLIVGVLLAHGGELAHADTMGSARRHGWTHSG